jgi:hypothetical protein
MYYFLQQSKNNIYNIPYLKTCRWTPLEWPLEIDIRWLNYIRNDNRNQDGKCFSELYDNTFFHFRAGGNWEKYSVDVYERRIQPLTKLVYDVCRNE